jgi:hypothetical protein
MARVRFTKDFDYKPTPQTTVAYLAGMEVTVKRDCAERAVKLGRAVRLDEPKNPDASQSSDAATTASSTA